MKHKVIALSFGLVCHLLFFVAIGSMAYMLYFGMTAGILEPTEHGRAINFLLLLQFPIFHSFFLSQSGRKLLTNLFPQPLGVRLQTTTFACIASIQLLLVFLLWTPTTIVWFIPHGTMLVIWSAVYFVSWVLLVRALYEAGLGVQMGYLGWTSVLRGQNTIYPPLPVRGLHGVSRQPIYIAFALILLTAPVWSPDHLWFAIVWVTYCFIGPLFKEKRLLKRHGTMYAEYRRRVPYIMSLGGLGRKKFER